MMESEIQGKPTLLTELEKGPLDYKNMKKRIKKVSTIQNRQKQLKDFQHTFCSNFKSEKWTKQTYLKYLCFLKLHKQQYNKRALWILRTCPQYVGLKNRNQFGQRHSNLKSYHLCAEAVIIWIQNKYRFNQILIDKQSENLVKYLQQVKIRENLLLEEPFQFQKQLQDFKFEQINQTCKIIFNQIIINSVSLNYAMINLGKSDRLIFANQTQRSKIVFGLFNAQFNPSQIQIQQIKSQIKQQMSANKEQKISKSAFSTELSGEIKQKSEECNEIISETQKKSVKMRNEVKELTQQKPNTIFQEPIYLQNSRQKSKFQETKNFGKAKKQFLDLSKSLGLSQQQIWQLELQYQTRLFQFRVMRKINNYNEYQSSKPKQQTQKQKAQEIIQKVFQANQKLNQFWTEQQILRVIVFMVLNQKLFANIHKIQQNVISLMLQFVKSKNYVALKSKYYELIRHSQSIQQALQKVFQCYKFTQDQFITELKRQYQRYLKQPAHIILQGQIIQSLYVPCDATETQIHSLIQQRMLKKHLEIACVTLGGQLITLNELIQTQTQQFKEEYGIKQEIKLKPAQIGALYQRINTDNPNLMTFAKFKTIFKNLEAKEKIVKIHKQEKLTNNKLYRKIGAFLSEFQQNLRFLIKIVYTKLKKLKKIKLKFVKTQIKVSTKNDQDYYLGHSSINQCKWQETEGGFSSSKQKVCS